MNSLIPGYNIRPGSTLDRALLVKFMQRTYQDMFPDEDFSHLARTVEQYLSKETPLWWVDFVGFLGDKEDDLGDSLEEMGTPWGLLGDNENNSGEPFVGFASRLNALNPRTALDSPSPPLPISHSSSSPVACLWVGNSIDQVKGDRHAHIFLLYVVNEHRRRGVGKALMEYVENWAFMRGDRQIGLQVFKSNQPALNLYNQLGYQTQSLWMVKSLDYKKI